MASNYFNTEEPRTPRIIRKYANKGRNVGAILWALLKNTPIPKVYVYVAPAPPRHLYGEHPQNEGGGAF